MAKGIPLRDSVTNDNGVIEQVVVGLAPDSDEQLLGENGWTIECESPFEIRHEDGSFATLNAANIVLDMLKSEEIIEKMEEMLNGLQ